MFSIIGADLKEYGPVSAEEIREWIKEGRADGRTLAREEGTTEWKPLVTFPEFAAFTSATGTPPRLTTPPPTTIPISPASNFDVLLNAREPDFDVGDCLSRGWALLMNNFGLLAGATFTIWLIDEVVKLIPIVDVFFSGVLYGGLYLVYLKRIRGQPTVAGEVFTGFTGPYFVQLLLAGFLTGLLAVLACCACLLPGLYLKIAWSFALALVIDKRLEFWTAMELSRKVATRVWFKVFALTVIVFAPYIIMQGFVNLRVYMLMNAQMATLVPNNGTIDFARMFAAMTTIAKNIGPAIQYYAIAAQAVLLLNLPFALAALMHAYEALFSPRPAPTP